MPVINFNKARQSAARDGNDRPFANRRDIGGDVADLLGIASEYLEAVNDSTFRRAIALRAAAVNCVVEMHHAGVMTRSSLG